MTFPLVVLLATLHTSPASALPGRAVQLPLSTTELAPDEDLAIQVSADALLVNDRKVLDLRRGVTPRQARRSRDDFLLRPLQSALRRALEERKATSNRGAGANELGRVNIVADARIPYRTLMEVLYTAGQLGSSEYRLVVLQKDGTRGALTVYPPRPEPARLGLLAADTEREAPRLLLVVAIARQGFYVAGAGGVLAPEPQRSGDAPRAPTVPLAAGAFDYGALTATLARIKERFPRETQVLITAGPDVVYETLIHTIDACREQLVQKPDGTTERVPLFSEVSLTLM